ncbi:TonB-dependent receptor domain-containing protein [Leptospira haakeii]|uniref:TonB-dependent receptor n=1 Tax=Leptospira haakeii TaxID=2023198 RepID=A0ABX4PMM8_9LEPT|nr:TonB-dependent receptor [Leptospira haakeii]PKA17049.1 TonB-dependent receptor [Leptospira haakeii]PKA19345.1 TonB-dependent receptor [Leptospira haakeii]
MKKIKFNPTILLIVFALLSVTPVWSQAAGKIRGKIVDGDNGEAVFGATIVVRSIKKFAKSDFDGAYDLELPVGTHEVEFQMLGYSPQKRTINVTPGKPQVVNITFGLQTLETVDVKGRALNDAEAALLALQKKSAAVSDGISKEAIKKSPDSSAGEVVRRVTGITLVGGKFVFVRGLGERYSNTELNDTLVPSTEPDKRVVALDIFPSGVLKNVRIMKTFLPELPGEFSGGLVKIETQEYPEEKQLSVSVGAGGNYNTTGHKFLNMNQGNFFGGVNDNQKMPSALAGIPESIPIEPGSIFGGLPPQGVQASAGLFNQKWTPDSGPASFDRNFSINYGDTFKVGATSRIGVLVGSTYNRNYRFRQESSNRYFANPLSTLTTAGTNLTLQQHQDADMYIEERNWGNNANIAYEITKGQQIFLKTLFTQQGESQVRDATGQDKIDNFDFKALTTQYTSSRIFHNTIGGDHALNWFGDRAHKFDWRFNYAEANRDQPDLQQQVWRRASTADPFTDYTRLGNNPDGSRFFSESKDTSRTTKLNYEIPFDQWSGLKSLFKFGTYTLSREKDFRFREFGQKPNTAVPLTNLYPVPGEIYSNPIYFVQNDFTFSERQVESNAYDAFQRLQAYYSQVELPILPKLKVLAGVRYEDSYQKVKTFATRDSNSPFNLSYGCGSMDEFTKIALVRNNICDPNNNGVGELRTKDKLPSFNVNWEFADNQILRVSATQTLTRPDLRELSPFGFTPYFGANRIFGNSDLRRSYIHNYDVRYEYYLNSTDYIGVGAFLKQISNPIEMIGQPIAGSIAQRFTYLNAEQGTIRGVEFDFRKDVTKWMRFEANMFLINSRVDVISWNEYIMAKGGLLDPLSKAAAYNPTNISRPLQGQSPLVFNIKFDFYLNEKKTQNIGVYYNYFGDRLFAVGANGLPDAYERAVGLTDVVYTTKRGDHLEFKVSAQNIFDTRYRVYQKNELTGEKELFLSYRTGVSYSFQATYKL